ncbi:MAG: hypothetical protein P8Z33_11535 [Gammaproteobacteria bacterium]|jgi:ketosteroid isomerase-like protein
MGIAENKQVVLDFYDAAARGDMDACFSLGTAETVDGTPYNNTYCQVIQIRNGRIANVKEYMDTALIDAVFGAV